MILSLQETLGYTRLFVIIINLRITFKMKVILNCPPKEESKYCEKIKSSNWKGNSSLPLCVKPLQVSEGFKQSKDHHILTDLHPLWKRTFLWGQLFWGLLLAKIPISVPSETSRQLRRWIWQLNGGYGVLDGFRYRTLWYVYMTWYGKNNALYSSWNVPTYSPAELTCLILCPKLTVVPHFPNTYLLEFSWIYTYDLRTSTQVHLLCLENLHSEIMETMRIYGVG